MKFIFRKAWILLPLLAATLTSSAQSAKPKLNGWHLLDQQKDGYAGISLNEAYELLKGRKSTRVIVAVIDSGLDTTQEDLKPIIWVNEKEVAANGIDDDHNGYIDDLHGWNFCGSKTGENLARNSHEITRVYHGWKAEFEGKKEKDIPASRRFLFEQWTKAAALINKEYEEAQKALPNVNSYLDALNQSSKTINAYLKTSEFTLEQVKPLVRDPNEVLMRCAALWTEVFGNFGGGSISSTAVIKEVDNYKTQLQNNINKKTTPPADWRGDMVRDNYTDINDRFYGNNNLKSGSGDHGTMVSGIIGAVRNNSVGVDGIADNVRIMAVRAVPGGDEHDKDVALAIRYAVDNGAKIINMSFGKPVSPYKQFVDDAVRYAESKGVLLIHGSGNDGVDITNNIFYPNPIYLDGKTASNYLTVGASGDPSTGSYAASFSNYSKQAVDIFAPGTNIYSTATDNRYVAADGTSAASPVVTGVAALLKSYFPDLTPAQIIEIINASGSTVDVLVIPPGQGEKKVNFASLSRSGKIVNAYGAVKLALEKDKR